jgi:uncharacterized protein YjiK
MTGQAIITGLLTIMSYGISAQISVNKVDIGYRLGQPERIIELPARLTEISGLTDFTQTEVGCVEDENGIIYLIDLNSGKISRTIEFSGGGDFEGITYAEGSFYVLRSDGVLFSVTEEKGKPVTDSIKLGMQTRDNEGLGYDPQRNRLLIAGKSRVKINGTEKKGPQANQRFVYEFTLRNKKFNPTPVITINLEDIHRYAGRNRVGVQTRTTRRGEVKPIIKFLPSSIAVHPVTKDIYILSAADRTLAVLSPDGNLKYFDTLPQGLFRKPEGITFLPGGDMIISNEADGGKPTLLIYKSRE